MSEPLNVLIVDDEKGLREGLAQLISALNTTHTYQAQNAYEALEILQKYPIDAVFLDVNMPGISGLEFLKMMRKEGFETPVILMTGYPSLELTVEALRYGATDFLIKPFTFQQVKETLARLKERQKKEEARDEYQELLRLLKQKTQEQVLLFTISDRLTSCTSLSRLYREIVNLAKEFTEAEEVVFYLLDFEEGRLLPQAWEGKSSPSELTLSQENPIVKSIREGIPYLAPSRPGEKALLVAPFTIKGECLGVLVLRRERDFTKDNLFFVNIILERAAPLAENFILHESLILNLHDALRALVKALEAKDPYTKEHSERVTKYALLIAEEMELSEDEVETLRFAGHLHDVGKVGIADAILLKPGRLTPEEYEIIKRHPVIGAEIVGRIALLQEEALIIRYHHERFDGKGYPEGLKGEEIPLLARVLAVADAYDAMTTRRPYRPSRLPTEALNEILRCSGTQFDPEIVKVFKEVWRKKIFSLEEEKNVAQFVA